MKVDFDTYQLGHNETDNPIIYKSIEEVPYPEISQKELKAIFPHNRHQLKTWGGRSTSECHFIAVQKQTPLHTDKGFPKYTHHLVLYVDDFVLRGLSKRNIPIYRGSYFVLDGHSPHQLLALGENKGCYVAVSFDSHEIQDKAFVLEKMYDYLSTTEITNNLNGKNL